MPHWQIDTDRLIHSCKTAVACVFGFILTKVIHLPEDQWILVTIIVVMCAQLFVGSVIQKAYLRFLGTILGCLFASSVILLFGLSNFSIALTIAVAIFLFSYMATSQENLSYAGTLGAVTTVIILIGQQPTLIVVGERFIEISFGILIATLISQFFLPINARTYLRRLQAATLLQMNQFYAAALVKHQINSETEYQALDEAIIKSLFKQRQLAAESKREFLGTKFSPEHFMKTLYAEREIIRAIAHMRTAYLAIHQAHEKLDSLPAMKNYHEAVSNCLTTLTRAINTQKYGSEHIHLPDTATLKRALQPVLLNGEDEQTIVISAYLFSTELLAKSLEKIASLYGVKISPNA